MATMYGYDPVTHLKYCDWRIEIVECVNRGLWMFEGWFSFVTYGLLTISGILIFIYRYKYMWQGLFVDHGAGIRPLPVDCLLVFFTGSAALRAIHSFLMLYDFYTAYWQRELGQEIGWTFMSWGAVLYLVGIIYTIPVNYTFHGTAVVSLNERPSDKKGFTYTTHELFIPSPSQLNICLAIWCIWPTVIALPCAILSGISKDRENYVLANRYTLAQYTADFIFDMSYASICVYYGWNFMLILRSSFQQFDSRSEGFHSMNKQNTSGTRQAFQRLKYTMMYLSGLGFFTGPWWFVWGVAHTPILESVNGISIFLSVMWYITGAQPLYAVCQYILIKRIWKNYMRSDSPQTTSVPTGIVAHTPKVPPKAVVKNGNVTESVPESIEMDFSLDMKSSNGGGGDGENRSKSQNDWDLLTMPEVAHNLTAEQDV